jgi:8-oxo-dGTP diphosphatase
VTIPTSPVGPDSADNAVDAGRPPRHLQPGDGWVECTCGRRHWGLAGAAGLLLARRATSGDGPAPDAERPDAVPGPVTHILLQHRAPWSDQGGTWGVPGGAIHPDETPVEGALREAAEEAGVVSEDLRVLGESVLDHGPWRYTTVLAELLPGRDLEARATDAESLEIAWVALEDVFALPLLPAFRDALPDLLTRFD